ncbi:MAG TPA: C4-type zinc ribbon domain-containing protein [Actinomycetospora sp.]|nr:C4-type zinc ribbon domain-containing protein [Actinomycetospora sp.]
MKADPTVQRKLLDLAALDAELARAEHRRRTMPEQTAVEEAEAVLRTRRDAVVRARTAVSDLGRDVAKLEQEVAQVSAREQRDRGLLDSGSVSAKQMTDLSHELETLARRRGVLEDSQLEAMERLDAAETDLAHEQAALDEAETTLADAVERRDGVLGDIEVIETRRGAERRELAASMPADLLGLYDQLLARTGHGAGELVGARCGACRMEMDRSEVRDIAAAAPDEVVRCEQCGAIVVRTGKGAA